MVAQVQRQPLAAQAAQLLLTRIKDGEWALGQRLPGETTLAAQLGVGRSTLREAIRELAGKGVLDSRQGAGVFVTALDVPDDWDTVLRSANMQAEVAASASAKSIANESARRRAPACNPAWRASSLTRRMSGSARMSGRSPLRHE